jgi:threonine dehydratase
MDEIIHNLTSNEDMFSLFVVFGVGGLIAIVAIVLSAVKKMVVSSNLEQSRREIAAYIAEGSMTPEDGERLLNAGNDKSKCG